MTVGDVLAACVRRWPVTLFGLALVGVVLTFLLRATGVYWTQADVVFLSPASDRFPNPLGTTSQSLIAMAGVTEREVNRQSPAPATAAASASVTIVDEGVRDGARIRLPNSGGQWANNFDRPVLDVQAVGPTPERAAALFDAAVERVRSSVYLRQRALGVEDVNMIHLTVAPSATNIFYADGERKRAIPVAVLLGAGLTMAAATLADQWAVRRRRASSE